MSAKPVNTSLEALDLPKIKTTSDASIQTPSGDEKKVENITFKTKFSNAAISAKNTLVVLANKVGAALVSAWNSVKNFVIYWSLALVGKNEEINREKEIRQLMVNFGAMADENLEASQNTPRAKKMMDKAAVLNELMQKYPTLAKQREEKAYNKFAYSLLVPYEIRETGKANLASPSEESLKKHPKHDVSDANIAREAKVVNSNLFTATVNGTDEVADKQAAELAKIEADKQAQLAQEIAKNAAPNRNRWTCNPLNWIFG